MTAGAEPQTRRWRVDGALVLLTVYWGFTFVVVKDALSLASPMVFLALRFGLGATALSLFAGRRLGHGPSVRAGLLLGLFLFLGYALQTAGLEGTTPARSAFITSLSVALVPFVSLLLLRHSPSPTSWAGVVLAVVGLAVLTGGAGIAHATLRGDLLTLGCAAAFGFHITLTGHYAPGAKVTALVAVQLWVVAVLSALAVVFTGGRFLPSPPLAYALLYTGLLGSAGGITLQSWAQARTSAVRAAIIFALEPVLAAFFSIALGREQLGVREGAGGLLVVFGVLVAEVGGALSRAPRGE